MSNFDINQEAMDAQQQYEVELQEVKTSISDQQPISTQVNPQNTPIKVRPGWNMKSEGFWTFNNYDNLPAEYKVFIPREQTKSKNYPNGTVEPITHQDPFDGQTYKFGVTFFENGGTSVWSRVHDPNRQSSSGGYKKSFYLDCGIKSFGITEADALLAANESSSATRYKVVTGYPVMNKAQAPDGSVAVRQEERVLLLKQKRIEY